MTEVQQAVVNARLKMGYELFGFTPSISTTPRCAVLNKGKHMMVINCLGYDERVQGVMYKLYEAEG